MPTVNETAIKGFSAQGWYGLLAPASTPRTVITKLNDSLNTVLREADMQQRIKAMGNEIAASTPEAFDAWIRAELPKWAETAKRAGMKQE